MSANAYARIAERYQVFAADDEAVERFFLDVAPTLSREEREAIVAELRDHELAEAPTADVTVLPVDVPTFSIDDAPAVEQPNAVARLVGELSAAVEKRVSGRLDLIFRSLDGLHVQMAELKSSVPVARLLDGRVPVKADLQESVRDVVRRMAEAKVGTIAVLDQARLVGVFSERDLMNRVVAEGLDPDTTSVSSVMTRDIVAVQPQEDLTLALQKMQNCGYRYLPVVSNGKLVGMISMRDIVHNGEKMTISDFLGEAPLE